MIGIVTGAFDLLHAGHINFLKQAKKNCDYLIVALHVDPSLERNTKNKPVESVLERQIKLSSCKYVDNFVVYETEEDLPIIFKYFEVDVRFLGTDYVDLEKEITNPDSIPIHYIQSLPIHTSDLRGKL